MFRPTDPQMSLLESQFLVPEDKRRRLERSWAHAFQRRILPLIDEEMFRDSFSDNNGRPNKSIRVLTGLHLLKEWNDLTDSQVLEQYEFNLQWHYALGVEPAQAHVSQKTLHNYRVRLMENERAQRMFEQLTQGLVELDGLDVGRQRLDSTHVISNIAVLTRLGVFTATVTKFLRELRHEAPDKLEQLADEYSKRYLDREGYFADVTKEQARRRLPMVAVDVYRLVTAFSDDPLVSAWESYQLLQRLLEEQCELVEDEESEAAPVKLVDDPRSVDEVKPEAAAGELTSVADDGAQPLVEQETDRPEAESADADEDARETAAACPTDIGQPEVVDTSVVAADSEQPQGAGEVVSPSASPSDTEVAKDSGEEPAKTETMPVRLKDAKKVSSASLQSPHDPDATYGHKGKGYEVQISETCVEDNPYQVITGVSVGGAHESDQHATVPMIDQLQRSRLGPKELLADTGYGSGQNIIDCAARGVDLQAPVHDPDAPGRGKSWSGPVEPSGPVQVDSSASATTEQQQPTQEAQARVDLETFAFTPTYDRVLSCPAGHTPARQHLDKTERTLWAEFSVDHCSMCPLAASCPTRLKRSGKRTLRCGRATAATARRQLEQQQPAFKERYKLRSGIESTNAELKGPHGADDLRVRGRSRVELSMWLKAMALNVKRAVRYHVAAMYEASRFKPVPLATGA